jgi:hypothetical protein
MSAMEQCFRRDIHEIAGIARAPEQRDPIAHVPFDACFYIKAQ